MLFDKVFIEHEVVNHAQTQHILKQLKVNDFHPITKVSNYFGKVKKPYLQKRQSLNLYIGKKRGHLVKPAPDAYGLNGALHYYFIHSFNCIYECEYCYLQGYFNSPDIVVFINHDEIHNQIVKTAESHSDQSVWFHAGEFSDSLALSHLTGECEFYFETFKNLKNSYLELRTKSANIRALKALPPLENVIISYSLAPKESIKAFDRKTATYNQRLQCIQTLSQLGHPVALHFDPIIYNENIIEQYQELIFDLKKHVDLNQLRYISLGVVRFTKEVYKEVERNYPHSQLLTSEFIKSFDNKVRYPRPMRLNILNTIKSLLIDAGIDKEKLYLCME